MALHDTPDTRPAVTEHHYVVTVQWTLPRGQQGVATLEELIVLEDALTEQERFRTVIADIQKRHPNIERPSVLLYRLTPNQH